MKTIKRVVLLTSLCFFIIFMPSLQPQEEGFLYGTEYEVRVINGFSTNSSLPLVIWCSSEHVDLGGRALQEGDDFSWSVTTTTMMYYFWQPGRTTGRYLCTVKWDAKRKSFDAFKVERDRRRCGASRKCCWLVKEDGFYFSSDEVHWVKEFHFSWL